MPCKVEKRCLDNNRKNSEIRLVKLNRRFIRPPPPIFFKYKKILKDYLKQGIIEIVLNSEGKVVEFYLPHKEVIKRVPSKLSIVSGASAHD